MLETNQINIDELKSVLSYDEKTGIFRWKETSSKKMKPGSIAGTKDNYGYIYITYKGNKYKAHRIAYAFIYEFLPEEIDHINRNKEDNRIINLSPSDNKKNKKNKSKSINNTSGVNGVYWHSRENKYQASIGHNGKLIHLGYFDCISDAEKARLKANHKYEFSETHGKGNWSETDWR